MATDLYGCGCLWNEMANAAGGNVKGFTLASECAVHKAQKEAAAVAATIAAPYEKFDPNVFLTGMYAAFQPITDYAGILAFYAPLSDFAKAKNFWDIKGLLDGLVAGEVITEDMYDDINDLFKAQNLDLDNLIERP